jgi:hypothetical protein
MFGCPPLLIQYIRNYSPYLVGVSSIRILRTRHAVLTRDPPNMGRVFLLIKICCLAANFVSLFVSWSLPRNGSIRHIIVQMAHYETHYAISSAAL